MIYGNVLMDRFIDVLHDKWAGDLVRFLSARPYLLIGIIALLYLLSALCSRKQNLVLLVLYGAAIIFLTLLSRAPGVRSSKLTLFWSYRLLPHSPYFQRQVMSNILLFVPVGVFLYRLRPKCSTFCGPFLVSLGVEVLQYLTARGLFEIDDLISNTLGGLIGCIAVLALESARQKSRDVRK